MDKAYSFKGAYIPNSLVKELGIDQAFLYCYVLNKLPDGKRKMILTMEEVTAETGLNDYLQRNIFKKLADKGYLKDTKERVQSGDSFQGVKRHVEVLRVPRFEWLLSIHHLPFRFLGAITWAVILAVRLRGANRTKLAIR